MNGVLRGGRSYNRKEDELRSILREDTVIRARKNPLCAALPRELERPELIEQLRATFSQSARLVINKMMIESAAINASVLIDSVPEPI